jgi:hypothetical protein
MTIKLLQSAAATLRRAFGKGAVRTRRAGLAGAHGPFNHGNEATPGRYFGLLVHVDRSDR